MSGRLTGAILFCYLFAFAKTYGQRVDQADFAAWAQRNNFVAGQDWRSFLQVAPGNMGPNALPIYWSNSGWIDSTARFGVSSHFHTAPGDNTTDIGVAGSFAFGKRAALEVSYLMFEWYDLSPEVALQRNVLSADPQGRASGDVHISSHFQVLKGLPKFPDLSLTARIKTASGTRLEDLRFTDAPGYWFDATFTKVLTRNNPTLTIRPYVGAGFYVWQRFALQNPQNDAFTYHAGVVLHPASSPAEKRLSWQLRLSLAGYAGYENDGDQPLVVRLRAETVGRVNAFFQAAHGLHDFPYTSFGLGLHYRWKIAATQLIK